LPLDGDARSELWRLALQQNQPDADRLRLHVALARHCGHGASHAAAEGRWGVMERELAEAQIHYQEIAQRAADRQTVVKQELANLLGKLISDLHGAVHGEPEPSLAERADWCWEGFRLTQRYRSLQPEPPDWLWHLEEQLVRQGAIDRRLQLTEPGEASPTQQRQWQQQALELLLHLSRLHSPCPEWIGLAARELLAAEVDQELTRTAASGEATDLAGLKPILRDLARLPLPADQRAKVQLAAQRGIWGLQLLEQRQTSGTKPAPAASAPPQPRAAIPEAVARDPRALYKAIGLGVQRWLEDHPAGCGRSRLEPVLRPGESPVLSDGARSLQFNLAPLLAFPTPELLDQLVPAFFLPLQEAERGVELDLAEPCSQLWSELLQRWTRGERLQAAQWRGLVYCTALWSRCGSAGELEATAMPWSLPVGELTAGRSLLRPGNVELAALQTVLQQPGELEELLAEIRRRHHDRSWMETQRDHWWFDPSDGSENLRRLHTNAGFYASSHAPLESLQRWSQGTLRALMGGPVLFGNSSITQMFWPVAQAMLQNRRTLPALVQWPGEQAFYDFIADQELLFVTPLATDVEAHHRSGRAFQLFTDLRIQPYGLRCLEAPMSVYPNRPDRGFEASLERILEQVDRLYRQKPFTVFTAACGAYGLPLCDAVKQRYGVSCVYLGNLMHTYLGVLQRGSDDWRREQRIEENWMRSDALSGVPGVDRIENGRYLS
jgi:hypothetical protein